MRQMQAVHLACQTGPFVCKRALELDGTMSYASCSLGECTTFLIRLRRGNISALHHEMQEDAWWDDDDVKFAELCITPGGQEAQIKLTENWVEVGVRGTFGSWTFCPTEKSVSGPERQYRTLSSCKTAPSRSASFVLCYSISLLLTQDRSGASVEETRAGSGRGRACNGHGYRRTKQYKYIINFLPTFAISFHS